MSKKIRFTLLGCLLAAGLAQAASLTDVDAAKAVGDYSGADFSGQSVTTALNNWGYNDNLSSADFSGATLTFNGGNQPFLAATITDADFSDTTFNITPYDGRFNTFRLATGTGASFVDSIWNFTLSTTTAFDNTGFFSNGAGASNSASKDDAFDFSGADINFDGTGAATLTDSAVAIIIENLGSTGTGDDAFGAKYDNYFVNKNWLAFGYADADSFETALDTAGWQLVVVSPVSLIMIYSTN